jgi:hypothetical protein
MGYYGKTMALIRFFSNEFVSNKNIVGFIDMILH